MTKPKHNNTETQEIKQKQVIATVIFFVVTVLPWFSLLGDSGNQSVGAALSAAYGILFMIWVTPVLTWIFILVQYYYFKKRGSKWAVPFRVLTFLIPICFALWGLIYFLNKPIN